MTGVTEPKPATLDPEEQQRRAELVSAIHAALSANWARHGIEVPPLHETWQTWLRSAIDTATDIEIAEPRARMGVLAIPPADQLLSAVGRNRGIRITRSATSRCPDWRLLAVDMKPDAGIYLGSPSHFFETFSTLVGYEVGELGLVEYEALVLQAGRHQIDTATFAWTWLPKSLQETKVLYATTDPIHTVAVRSHTATRDFPTIRFRLAAEVPHPEVT